MKPCIIKTEEQYDQALERIGTLMMDDPAADSDAGRELDLLAMLVEQYEDLVYPIDLPSPIAAIRFRMDQAGMKQKDLQPYIGSASKVSEVLNGKRPLSLSMIRKLHKGLGIPAEVLLADSTPEIPELVYDVSAFPFNEMLKRDYISFSGSVREAKEYGEELLSCFFNIFNGKPPHPVHCRSGKDVVDHNSLVAWQARCLYQIKTAKLPAYKADHISEEFASTLAKLSYTENGTQSAVDFLNKKGIHVVFLKHLPGTHLDGASFMSPDGNPVIAMTLRHDRIDNFWFTLLHELGHIHLHISEAVSLAFFDSESNLRKTQDKRELEANQFAANALIPEQSWVEHRDDLLNRPTESKVNAFAEMLTIHRSIVAGRIRFEKNIYKLLPQIDGKASLRKQFALV